jgi:hypothetical protein
MRFAPTPRGTKGCEHRPQSQTVREGQAPLWQYEGQAPLWQYLCEWEKRQMRRSLRPKDAVDRDPPLYWPVLQVFTTARGGALMGAEMQSPPYHARLHRLLGPLGDRVKATRAPVGGVLPVAVNGPTGFLRPREISPITIGGKSECLTKQPDKGFRSSP